MKKKLWILCSFVVFIVLVIVFFTMGGMDIRKQFTTKSVNLSNEKINEFQLMDKSKPLMKKYNLKDPYVQSEKEEGWIGYRFKKNNDLYIRTDLDDNLINFDFTNQNFKTSRGISIGDDIEKVQKHYGNKNYKIVNDQGQKVVGYIDRKNKIRLEFYYDNSDKVYEVNLSKLSSINGDIKIFGKWV